MGKCSAAQHASDHPKVLLGNYLPDLPRARGVQLGWLFFAASTRQGPAVAGLPLRNNVMANPINRTLRIVAGRYGGVLK